MQYQGICTLGRNRHTVVVQSIEFKESEPGDLNFNIDL